MKKQIQNYDLLINKISTMQHIMENNFMTLHKITKQHSISLSNIKTNVNTNTSYLQYANHSTNNLFKLQNGNKNNEESNNNNDNNDDEEKDEIDDIEEFPLSIKPIHDDNDDSMVLLSEQLTPHIVSNHNLLTTGFNNGDTHIYQGLDNDDDDKVDESELNHRNDVEDDSNSMYPKLPQSRSDYKLSNRSSLTRSLDNVDTISVQTIDATSYKFQQQSLQSRYSNSLLLSGVDRGRGASIIKMSEQSMMKKSNNNNYNDSNNNKQNGGNIKVQKSRSDGSHNKEDNYNDFSCTDKENMIVDEIMENLTKLEELSNDFTNFMDTQSDVHKQETKQMIKSKLKPLHEILDQREMGLLSDLRYLHKEKTVKMKQKQHIIQQNKNFLKMKLVECQKILQQYQTKWDKQYESLKNQYCKNNGDETNGINNDSSKFDFNTLFKDNQFDKKLTNLKMNLIKERHQQLTMINNQVNEQIGVNILERDIGNLKQMYTFTVNSADLRLLKEVILYLYVHILLMNANDSDTMYIK